MTKQIKISLQTRKNWLIDVTVFLGALLAMFSGLYFFFIPSGGYEGGRNIWYGVTILFTRATWHTLHTWGGLLMITAVIVHLIIHWRWIKMMSRRLFNAVCKPGCRFSKGAKVNVVTDALVAMSFLVTAVTGVYFYFLPSGGSRGGRNLAYDPHILFSRATWNLIHTWAGVMLMITAVVHIWIHRRWISNVTRKIFLSLVPTPTAATQTA